MEKIESENMKLTKEEKREEEKGKKSPENKYMKS